MVSIKANNFKSSWQRGIAHILLKVEGMHIFHKDLKKYMLIDIYFLKRVNHDSHQYQTNTCQRFYLNL